MGDFGFEFPKRSQLLFRTHNETLSAIAAIMVSIVRSIGGYKPPFPIPEKQSAECIKADFPELWKIQLQNFILRFP
jgi:hypothetical protein